MNIVVVLRAVQDPAGLMVNLRAQKVFVNREAHRLNPADHNALEAALRQAGTEHRVTVIGYGGAPVEDVLRDALAAGADRAVWIQAPTLQFPDAAVLTDVLRRALERQGSADLVLFGAEVVDADLAQVAPRLATALDAAFVGPIHDLRLGEAGEVQMVVRGPDGYRWIEADAPVVAAVARDSNQPRFAPAARIITVYSTPEAVEMVALDELGLSEAELAPLTERRGESFPPERELGTVLEGGGAETAKRIADELKVAIDGHQ
jgi:electron transfer flavoprotein beta subunit